MAVRGARHRAGRQRLRARERHPAHPRRQRRRVMRLRAGVAAGVAAAVQVRARMAQLRLQADAVRAASSTR